MHCEHTIIRRTWWGTRRHRTCGAPAVALVARPHQGIEQGVCISDVTAVCADCRRCETLHAAAQGMLRLMTLTEDDTDPACPSCGTDLRGVPVVTIDNIPGQEVTTR